MKKLVALNILIALLWPGLLFAEEQSKELMQLAILLDTSNSMDGLINQAKTQLWKIVNEFALMRKAGKIPDLEIALYEYGKQSLPPAERFLRLIVPFTSDLDKISQELFALTTYGGEEFCGAVIKSATDSLQWSNSDDHYKAIFIAGNEPFTQGDIEFKAACQGAIAKGIIVNTIYCGSYDEGVATQWKQGALLADGKYLNIDQNQDAIEPETPQDKQIVTLGQALNKTYIAYGARGGEGKKIQAAQDAEAQAMAPSVSAERAVAKSSVHYKSASWDLVDALKTGTLKLEDVAAEDLPQEMRSMSPEERNKYIEAKIQEREKLQQEIQKLNEDRRKYLAEEAKKGAETLDSAMIDTLKDQVAKKGYQAE